MSSFSYMEKAESIAAFRSLEWAGIQMLQDSEVSAIAKSRGSHGKEM